MIEVVSKFDSTITNPLIKLQIRKLRWFFILFSLLFIFLGIMSIITSSPDIGFGVGMIIFGLLFLPFIYLLAKFSQKRINKTMKIINSETINYFKFDENKMYQELKRGEDFKATSETSYKMLYKACETKSHFFIFISNSQTHVIPKKDIVLGTSQELSNIFSAKLGKNFKILKMK